MTAQEIRHAEDDIDQLVSRLASPLAMAEFARSFLLPKGHGARARSLCDQAIALAPNDGQVRTIHAEVHSADVGVWFFTMVRDEVRQAAYERAIARAVSGGARVLDIGTGTGLLAMMAARAGASQVFSCEFNEGVAEMARQIVARNGYSDRVTIVGKKSTELVLGEDLPEPADVLIWDNTGSDLLGLGTLPALEDAARRLIKPGGLIIPAGASIWAALADYTRLSSWRMDSAAGFDLTPFNALAQPVIPLDHGNRHLGVRSDPVRLFDFHFAPDVRFFPDRASREGTSSGGEVNGLVQWVEFRIDDRESYSAGPDTAFSAFNLNFRPARRAFTTEPGQTVVIGAAHDRQHVRLWLEEPR
jgi:predicted O-methyltransferase YrrM